MSLAKNRKKFESYKQQEVTKAEEKANKKNTGYVNPSQIKFEAGKTYRLRLLYDDPDDKDVLRDGPFLETYTHGAKGADEKWVNITCPTTHGKEGWNTCSTCKNNNKLYANFEATGSVIDKALYDRFKRKFNGFALAMVVNDPTTPENNGHAKFFRFSIRQKRWLDREIFGIVTKNKFSDEEDTGDDDGESVGYDAFDLKKGVDLIITVTEQGKFLNYDFKFSRKTTKIEHDEATLEAEIAEINIDNYLRPTTDAEVENFYRVLVLEGDADDSVEDDGSGTGIVSDDLGDELDEIEKEPVVNDEEIDNILNELDEFDD